MRGEEPASGHPRATSKDSIPGKEARTLPAGWVLLWERMTAIQSLTRTDANFRSSEGKKGEENHLFSNNLVFPVKTKTKHLYSRKESGADEEDSGTEHMLCGTDGERASGDKRVPCRGHVFSVTKGTQNQKTVKCQYLKTLISENKTKKGRKLKGRKLKGWKAKVES